MRDLELPPSSVVVGIDGSRWAVDAALWATDEAVSRDIPLRLVYAIESVGAGPNRAAHELATAELAVRHAFTAVESTDKPVKMEVEIVQRGPTRALLEASRSAAMTCVGSTGLHHATRGRIGSTASALAASAHCPVAIVHRRVDAKVSQPGAILAVLDESAAGTVLERGLEEAQLRGAPLRVLTMRPSPPTDGCHWAQAELNRRLAQWQRRYPDLDIVAQAAHGNMLEYLERNAGSVQLVVVDHGRLGADDALLAPAARTTLDKAGCTVLICHPESRL
jgi:nucleotide-binding universal stress UspA family protein